jgi:hypothetical protein
MVWRHRFTGMVAFVGLGLVGWSWAPVGTSPPAPPLEGEGRAEAGDRAVAASPTDDYVVRPYLVVPGDQPFHPAYQRAAQSLTREVQQWYLGKAGVTFRLAPLQVVRTADDYLTMRCGPEPTAECRTDRQKLPNWPEAVERAVGGWKPRSIAWVFAQGGGGWAGGVLFGEYSGYGLFGDWVLEPISGVAEPAAITCANATWQCQGGVPKGTTAHELGHAFGLHHPDDYPGKTIMRWHGDYPDTDLLPHEVLILKHSPYFVPRAFDEQAPWLDFENPDVVRWAEMLKLTGRSLRRGDTIEFVDLKRAVRVRPELVSDREARVRVPEGMGPGFIRARRGRLRGNAVPVNLYPADRRESDARAMDR